MKIMHNKALISPQSISSQMFQFHPEFQLSGRL